MYIILGIAIFILVMKIGFKCIGAFFKAPLLIIVIAILVILSQDYNVTLFQQ